MRVLFDNSTPRALSKALQYHSVTEARAEGWDQLRNGDLLNAAEEAGYEVLVTPDQNMRYQQNLAKRKIALIVLGKGRWTLVKNHLPEISAPVNAATPGSFHEVGINEPRRSKDHRQPQSKQHMET